MSFARIFRFLAEHDPTSVSYHILVITSMLSWAIFFLVNLGLVAYVRTTITNRPFYSEVATVGLLEFLGCLIAVEAAFVAAAYQISGLRAEAYRTKPELRIPVLRMLNWRERLCFPLTMMSPIFVLAVCFVPIIQAILIEQVYPAFFYPFEWNPPLALLGLLILFGGLDALCLMPLLSYIVFSARLNEVDLIVWELRFLADVRSNGKKIERDDWFYLVRSTRQNLDKLFGHQYPSRAESLRYQLAPFFVILSDSSRSIEQKSKWVVVRIIDVVLSKDAPEDVLDRRIELMREELLEFTSG